MLELEKDSLDNLGSEEKGNLVNFFNLLLKVDRRMNPDLYKPQHIIINPLLWEEEELQCKAL